ncbi:MAG: hypothetical protein HZB77_12765, partial [Chloroflexi bacterium]|nr:hypothetical protein [Chloroflexota bacterium]
MAQTTLDEKHLKERKDFPYDVFAEVTEDLAIINAIKEGEDSETVSRS